MKTIIFILVYLLGAVLTYKNLKVMLSNNGNSNWTVAMRIFAIFTSTSSWLGFLVANPIFIKWAESKEDEIANW